MKAYKKGNDMMRKCVLIMFAAAVLLFSGCGLIPLKGGDDKPSPSVSDAASPEPSSTAEPSPSVKPSPEEEDEEASGSGHSNGWDLFGGNDTFSTPSGDEQSQQESEVQEAQIRTGEGESLSSNDDIVYTENTSVRADYDGNGTQEVLTIEYSYDYPQSDDMNFPVTITLTIGESSVVYENTWNDGVAVGIADFYVSDPELDIYIISLGTDVSAAVTTYWYDGSVIGEFSRFDIIEDTSFWYDTQGTVYYKGEYEGDYGVMVAMDYYEGNINKVD
jgi:hypothetical protein